MKKNFARFSWAKKISESILFYMRIIIFILMAPIYIIDGWRIVQRTLFSGTIKNISEFRDDLYFCEKNYNRKQQKLYALKWKIALNERNKN